MNDFIKIILTRDSVCAGDDFDGLHKKTLNLYPDESVNKLIDKIFEIKYLPTISGGKATWVVKTNAINIAVLAEQWNQVKYFIDDKLTLDKIGLIDNKLNINIEYYSQIDPEYIYKEISKGNNPNKW